MDLMPFPSTARSINLDGDFRNLGLDILNLKIPGYQEVSADAGSRIMFESQAITRQEADWERVICHEEKKWHKRLARNLFRSGIWGRATLYME